MMTMMMMAVTTNELMNPINYLQSTLVCCSYDWVANSGFLFLPALFPFFFAQPRCASLLALLLDLPPGNRVRTGPGKPGKSWNFVVPFSRTGKSYNNAIGLRKFWKSV